MNARILAIAATLALGATVANANPFEGDQAIAARATATSAVSRADVQAQLADFETQLTQHQQLLHAFAPQAEQLQRAQKAAILGADFRTVHLLRQQSANVQRS